MYTYTAQANTRVSKPLCGALMIVADHKVELVCSRGVSTFS